MFVICISAGGGKSYLANKYPDEFIDIDTIVWNAKHKYYHKFLVDAIKNNNSSMIDNIYYKIISDNSNQIKKTKKIVLVREPVNAIWLKMKCLAIMRPTKSFHLKNIQKKALEEQIIAISNWELLSNYKDLIIEFDSNHELYLLIQKISNINSTLNNYSNNL